MLSAMLLLLVIIPPPLSADSRLAWADALAMNEDYKGAC
jgi:hypothetical protein